AIGILFGSFVRPIAAAVLAVVASGALLAAGLLVSPEPPLVPTAALGLLAQATDLVRPLADGLQALGIGLTFTGLLLGAALLLFAAGSLASGLSRLAGPQAGINWLIAARVVQGFGGGALVPLSMSLAAHLFEGRARAAALGLEGAATFIGMAVGPAYGAWVLLNVSLPVPGLAISGWQWIFLLNVPIAIVVLLAIYVVAGAVETPRHTGRTDLLGAALLSIALLSGVGALSEAGRLGWGD